VSVLAPGLRLNDRFILVEPIGAGGMSQVWRATDELLGRPVAVKMLAAELVADPGLRELTWREARAAARLTHPGVTRVYDYGEAALPGGRRAPFLVMELVEGQDLAGRLAAGPLPWPEVARIGAHVAAALAAAHELGVVHHDIKPANVMLTGDGAKVLDFGTAALVGAVDQDALAGTPGYLAPERLEWAPAQPASDIYSLGVLLQEALTGQPPPAPAGPAGGTVHPAGGGGPGNLPPDLPGEVEDLLRACRSPDPAGRPPARRVARVLAGVAGLPAPSAGRPAGPPTVVSPAPAAVRAVARPVPRTRVAHRAPATLAAPRPGRRLTLVAVAVAAVVLGLVVGLVLAQPRSDRGDGGGPVVAERSDPPPGTGSPEPGRSADPRFRVAQLDQRISAARIAGLLDAGSARKLQDKLDDLVKELEKPNQDVGNRQEKVREKAGELRAEIDDLRADGALPAALASELQALVRRLQPS
jgi:serine/threonine-protein kinase